jgi:hypothetical protein
MDQLARYQQFALQGGYPSPWVDWPTQRSTLDAMLARAARLKQLGYRPVIECDLDLTTLLAPERAVAVLKAFAPQASGLADALGAGVAPAQAQALSSALQQAWADPPRAQFLLPSYTDTGITAYGHYLAAVLPQQLGLALDGAARAALAAWAGITVHAGLRNGYWDRDLASDRVAAGFDLFAARWALAGGELVFVSNRSPAMREDSLRLLEGIAARAGALAGTPRQPLFCYFGPGGSAYDASSKMAAQQHLEAGPAPGVYVASLVGGQPQFEAAPAGGQPAVVCAILDDRAESRKVIVAAAEKSAAVLRTHGLGEVDSVGIGTVGHVPEMSIVDAPRRLASFELWP